MKKITLLLLGIFALHTVACADTDKAIPANQLPQTAQQFIQTYFGDVKTSLVKQETDLFEKNYEVVFANGDRIDFDRNGEWTEVQCRDGRAVPAGIVPGPISSYVTATYGDVLIQSIERDRHSYEVRLSNRLELTFDLEFNLIDIDD